MAADRQQRRAPLTAEEEHALEELAEERIEGEERRRRPFTRGQIIRWVFLLTLVVLSLYVLGPGLIEVFSSAPQLARDRAGGGSR